MIKIIKLSSPKCISLISLKECKNSLTSEKYTFTTQTSRAEVIKNDQSIHSTIAVVMTEYKLKTIPKRLTARTELNCEL